MRVLAFILIMLVSPYASASHTNHFADPPRIRVQKIMRKFVMVFSDVSRQYMAFVVIARKCKEPESRLIKYHQQYLAFRVKTFTSEGWQIVKRPDNLHRMVDAVMYRAFRLGKKAGSKHWTEYRAKYTVKECKRFRAKLRIWIDLL